jgi:hypothetical protein
VFAFGSGSVTFGASLVIASGPGLTAPEVRALDLYAMRTRRAAAGTWRAHLLTLARRAAALLAMLAPWADTTSGAVEALPAPMAHGRGPPAPRSAAFFPIEKGSDPERQTAERLSTEGPPSMTAKRKRAPKRFPARGSLKIVSKIQRLPALVASVANDAPALRGAVCYVVTCAAGPNKVARRDLAIG